MNKKELLLQKMAILDELIKMEEDVRPKPVKENYTSKPVKLKPIVLPRIQRDAFPIAVGPDPLDNYEKKPKEYYFKKNTDYDVVYEYLDSFIAQKQDIVFRDVVTFFNNMVPMQGVASRWKKWLERDYVKKHYFVNKIPQGCASGYAKKMITAVYRLGSENPNGSRIPV